MDFQSAMETFAEAWVAANAGKIQPFQHQHNLTSITQQGEDSDSNNTQSIRRRDLKVSRSDIQLGGSGGSGMDLSTFRHHTSSTPSSTQGISGGGKAIPIHCLLKFNSETSESNTQHPPDVDDFLIVPSLTPFNDLLHTSLTLLGQPKETIRYAEGWISLRNWKPVRLDHVSDSPTKTVGDILQDLTNHATLNIIITRAKCPPAPEDLKEKLLRLLLAQSSAIPLGQVNLSSKEENNSDELRRRFDIWYSAQHTHTLTSLFESLSSSSALSSLHSNNVQNTHESRIQSESNHPPPNSNIPPSILNQSQSITHHHSHLFDSPNQNHPVYQGLSPQKTRMRTSFDPEMELPRLQEWFNENPHPSRHQIQQYVRELNGLECRKDRKPLDINNVIYWFKNARAAQKRNEQRFNGHSHSPSFSGQSITHRQNQTNSSGDPNNNNSNSRLLNAQSESTTNEINPSSSPSQEKDIGIRIKEEEDSTSLDVEAHEGEGVPRDLSVEGSKSPRSGERDRLSICGGSSSLSPRSSPPLSPRPQFELHHHSQLLSRFPPILDHHSFMAYHLNSFPFPHPGSHLEPTSAHKRIPFDFNPGGPPLHSLHQHRNNNSSGSDEIISGLLGRGSGGGGSDSIGSIDERRKRNRTFIDPVTEVPRLESWFTLNTHPSHSLILKYTEELNRSPYRLKFPKLEPKNVQFWFKNRRAKSKRLKMSI